MPSVDSNPTERSIKVILCTIAYREKLLDYALDVAAELQFDGIEVWGREPHLPEKFDENRLRATKKRLDATQVRPWVLGSYLRFGSTKNDLDISLADVLHIGRWLKTPLIRVWASDVSSADATEEVWQRTVQEASQACDRADKLNLTLVVEMHAGTLADTAQSAKRLVEQVNRECFKLNFQVASEPDGQTPQERLEMVLPWVAHVHAQNYGRLPGCQGENVARAPLAAGAVSYPNLLALLRSAGYSGSIAVEFAYDETGDKRQALAEDLQFLRAIC